MFRFRPAIRWLAFSIAFVLTLCCLSCSYTGYVGGSTELKDKPAKTPKVHAEGRVLSITCSPMERCPEGYSYGQVGGRILHADSKEPLAFASVSLEGTVQEALTDIDGNFMILAVRPGRYDMRMRLLGFWPTIVPGVEVGTCAHVRIEMTLGQLNVELQAQGDF